MSSSGMSRDIHVENRAFKSDYGDDDNDDDFTPAPP